MTDPNEIRFVYREETFNDLAVRELAQTRAKCICRLQNKRCTKNQCKSCPQFIRFFNCKSMMSEYDQQRLDNYTADYYGEFSASPSHFMTHKEYNRYYRNIVLIIIVCLAVFCLLFSVGGPLDTPRYEVESGAEVSEIYTELIGIVKECMRDSGLYGYDLNSDGEFNCQDRAILFKLYWDDYMCELAVEDADDTPEQRVDWASYFCNNCEFIWNYDKRTGGLNHLFIVIYDAGTGEYIMLEPSIENKKDVRLVKEAFPGRYFPQYNIWGCTEQFMSELDPRFRQLFRSVK